MITPLEVKPGMPLEKLAVDGNLLFRGKDKELVVQTLGAETLIIANSVVMGKTLPFLHCYLNNSYSQEESIFKSSSRPMKLLSPENQGPEYMLGEKTLTAYEWAVKFGI